MSVYYALQKKSQKEEKQKEKKEEKQKEKKKERRKEKKTKRKAEELQDDNNNDFQVKRKKSEKKSKLDQNVKLADEKVTVSKTVVVNGHSVEIPNRRRTRSVSLSEESDPVAQKGKFSNFSISNDTIEKLKGKALFS